VPPIMLLVALGVVYAVSLLVYLHHAAKSRAREEELNRTSRGRVTQSTHRVMSTAA